MLIHSCDRFCFFIRDFMLSVLIRSFVCNSFTCLKTKRKKKSNQEDIAQLECPGRGFLYQNINISSCITLQNKFYFTQKFDFGWEQNPNHRDYTSAQCQPGLCWSVVYTGCNQSFFVLSHQPCRIHLCLKLYIVHVNTFPSPNSRQLLNPGRLNDGSGQCPAVTSGAFIICLVGSDPVSWGMQPPGAGTIIPVAQVSSSLPLHATCWEDSTLHLQ